MFRSVAGALVALFLSIEPGAARECLASFYGAESGHRTASGERFNPAGLTAAHRTYRPGTRLRVTYHGRQITVRVNDFGPALWTHRCLDLSRGAAEALHMIRAGVGLVSIEKLR